MTARCLLLRSRGPGYPSHPGYLALGCCLLLLFGCLGNASGGGGVPTVPNEDCTVETIPSSDLTTNYSTASKTQESDGVWCPDASDNAPFIQIVQPDMVWGVRWFRSRLVTDSSPQNFDGYASRYNISIQQESPDGDWHLLSSNVSAVTKNSTHTIQWTLVYKKPLPFTGLRIFPTTSLNVTGLCMNLTLLGCRLADLCPADFCGDKGECVGENLCSCSDGFFGSQCSLSAYELVRTVYRLTWTKVSDTEVSSGKGEFTCNLSGGFSLIRNTLVLDGNGSFLYTSSLTDDFQCLLSPDAFSSLYVSFTYALREFGSSVIGLFGTSALEMQKGVSAWLSRSDDEGEGYYLIVVVRRLNLQWKVTVRAEAIQMVDVWVHLEISWSLAQGLALYVQGEEVSRSFRPTLSNDMQDASHFVIGYPSYGYAETYEVRLLVREFTVSNQTRQELLLAFKESCPVTCVNGGLCSDMHQCTCLGNYHGPACKYTESGASLEVESQQGSSVKTNISSFSLQGSGTFSITANKQGFSIEGNNTYLHSAGSLSAPWSGLLDTSLYAAFTVALRFSVDGSGSTYYVMCSSYNRPWTGVNVLVTDSLLLIVQVKLLQVQWEVTYQFKSQEKLTAGMLLEFTFKGDALVMYLDGEERGAAFSATTTDSLTTNNRSLVFGAPAHDPPMDVEGGGGVTVQGMSMWTKSRKEITKVEEPGEAVDLEPEEETDKPDEPDTEESECSKMSFATLEKTIANLTLTLLTMGPDERTQQCLELQNVTKTAELRVKTCWRPAEARNDSTSEGAFLKFVKAEELLVYKSITVSLCENSEIPAEPSEGCDLTATGKHLRQFGVDMAEYGQGPERCSLLWTTYKKFEASMETCSHHTKSTLSELRAQVGRQSSMACNPSTTCNVYFALSCVAFAERTIKSIPQDTEASEEVCSDLKRSLAFATNHTIDCSGSSYTYLFEKVDWARTEYHKYCGVTAPPSPGKLSAQNATWMLQTAAEAHLFSKAMICSFANRKEWFGEDPKTSSLLLSSPILRDLCLGNPEEPPVCQCADDAESRVQEISGNLVSASFQGDTSICNLTEGSIQELFSEMTGCDSENKSAQVKTLQERFSHLCGRSLDTNSLICATDCDISACEASICGDISECLAQNSGGCKEDQVLVSALHYQAVRKDCKLSDDDPGVRLTSRPALDSVLQCMKTAAAAVTGEISMPMGQYCTALDTISNCFDELEKDRRAKSNKRGAKAAAHSKAILEMISTTVCDFMPETACGTRAKADVVFVLDGSGSVGKENMELLFSFMGDIMEDWDIGQDEIRVAAVMFASETELAFHLNKYDDKEDLIDAINNIEYKGGTTNTASALTFMADEMFSKENGNRRGVPDFAVIITDGMSNNKSATLAAAKAAKQRGIRLVSVGIGNGLDMDELEAMASPPLSTNVLTVANYSQLTDIQSDFLQHTCSAISNLQIPFTPSEGSQCSALHRVIQSAQTKFLITMAASHYSLSTRERLCGEISMDMDDVSQCGEEEKEYLEKLHGRFVGAVQQLCHQAEPVKGCDITAAKTCYQQLGNAFILPAVPACSLYSATEVCVRHNTINCFKAVSWSLTGNLDGWKEIAESTCIRGQCDPAEAVLCFMNIHHMAKSPVPDWEGICSSLESSTECAERNVIGCDRCQRDTIKTIGGKINLPLMEKCRDPPEFKCRALAAMECKEKLIEFIKSDEAESDGLLCLKVFEARKCIADLTSECEGATRLSISVELEDIVTSAGGESCSKDKILPACYETLADRVHVILSFDALDRSDPAYKYKPEAQDSGDKDNNTDSSEDSSQKESGPSKSKDSKEEGKSSKNSKPKSEHSKDSKSKSKGSTKSSGKKNSSKKSSKKSSKRSSNDWSMESVEEVDFPSTYLGKICREAQLAYSCVSESLLQNPPASVLGLADAVSATWQLAWQRCEDIVEPLSCYTCDNATDNEACNKNEPVECSADQQMCQTDARNTKDGMLISIEKKCVVPYECKPGCKDNTCTYCCNTRGGCNKPYDGPLTGTCNLVEASGCLAKVASAVLKTDKINCSLVDEQVGCIENARKECEANGNKAVAETLSGFLASKTVAKCRVELTDGRCGLYAVSAAASLFVSGTDPDSVDTCKLLSSIEGGMAAAASQKDLCGEEELKAMNTSFEILRSQMWFLDCSPTIKPKDMCDPLAAFRECMPTSSSDCDLEEKQACIKNRTKGCHPVQQIFPFVVLRINAVLHCSSGPGPSPGPGTPGGSPNLSDDLRPFGKCIEEFITAFDSSQTDPVALFAPVHQLVVCLLTTWDVDFILNQPPVLKVYIREIFSYLEYVLLPAVQLGEGEGSVTVSPQCAEGLANTSAFFSQQIMLMLLRPFKSFSSSDYFCISSMELEVEVDAQLSVCTSEEKKYHLRLFTHLQTHRLSLCPDSTPLPQCSVERASQCMRRFSAYMDIAVDRDSIDICGALNSSITCVKVYTSTCDTTAASTVHQSVVDVVSVYRSICAEVVKQSVCDVEDTTEVTPACKDPTSSLQICGNMSVSLSCSAISELLACYKEALGSCTSDADDYQQHFEDTFPIHYDYAMAVCGLDLDTWNLTGEGCVAPICDPLAAAECLVLSDLTDEETATSKVAGRVDSAVQCLLGNLSGCDVAVRARVIYKIQLQLSVFISIFPTLTDLQLRLRVKFTDPFGGWVRILVDFAELLDKAVKSPKWDLMPLCWWLHDFKLFVVNVTEDNAFRTELFKRTSAGLQKALDGVCNEPDTFGVILNLKPVGEEDSACPAKDFFQDSARSFFEAAVTGILQQESHTHLCSALESVKTMDLSTCSAGRQHQMRLMITFFQLVASEVCTTARYCSVSMVRECVLDMSTTIIGLGTESSTFQVCRSINTLDACVSQFSYVCDNSSMVSIKASVRSIRQMAVMACGETQPDEPLPTCVDPDDSECDPGKMRRCSFREVDDLLSDFSDRDAHCRMLQRTQDCYDRVNKSCTDENAADKIGVTLNGLEALKDKWDCSDEMEDDSEPDVCTDHCDFTEARKCIDTLSHTLRFWHPLKGDVCGVVTKARQCLMSKTSECESSKQNNFQQHLKAVLDLHASLTSKCEDVYTCLGSLFKISRQIFSTDDAPEPTSGSRESSKDKDSSKQDSKEKGSSKKDSKEKGSEKGSGKNDSKGKGSGKGSGGSSGKGDQGSGGNTLSFLCQRAHQSWECAELGLRNLPKKQRHYLQRIIEPLWSVISEYCADSVPLECYTCSNVHLSQSLSSDKCQEETDTCRHNERCSSVYTNEDNKVYVTRGCMKFAHCHAKDKKDSNIKCCDTDLCNTNADINTEPVVESKCYIEFAVDCAFTFAENLVTRGSVECKTAMERLQCAAKYSEHCPQARSLYTAVGDLMLSLAQTTCVQGALSEGCSSIAVSSMQAILSNAYSTDFACSGLNASKASLDKQEERGECTALDLVALREMLSFMNIMTYENCHPDECQSPSTSSESSETQTEKTEDEEKDCNLFETSLCGRNVQKGFMDWSEEKQNDTCSAIEDDAMCAVTHLEGCEAPPCLQRLIDDVKQKAEDKCKMDFTSKDKDDGDDDSEDGDEEECRPSIVCDVESAMACVDALASNSEAELCEKLEEAVECHGSNIESCRSVLTVYSTAYFNITLGDAIKDCQDLSIDLKIPTDVYSSGAECEYNFLTQMASALGSDNFTDPFCSAAAEFQECPFTLPGVSDGFFMNDTMDMVEYLAPPEICEKGEQPDEKRKKRAAECSPKERGRAGAIIFIVSKYKTISPQSRYGLCLRLRGALEVIDEHMSKCVQREREKEILQRLLTFGYERQDAFCVLCDYEPKSCRPDLQQLCMEPFNTMSSFSKMKQDTLCRAAESGLKYLRKFSTDCNGTDMGHRVDAVRKQMRAVLGNSCPYLTLGLFCPEAYSSDVNSLPCNLAQAETCRPKPNDIGGYKNLFPWYCSLLKSNLTCARDSLEGCLASDIQHMQDKLDKTTGLDKEVDNCANTSDSLLSYQSACAAEEPCSVKGALACFELEEGDDPTNCEVLSRMRSCVDTSLQSCSGNKEVITVVHSLLSSGFESKNPNCTSPFEGLFSDEYICSKKFAEDFVSELKTGRTLSGVCNVFQEYKDCVNLTVHNTTHLASVLKPDHSFLDKMTSLYCQPDPLDASQEKVSPSCDLDSATFCLIKEILWVFSRQSLPISDNRYLCQKWHNQELRTCVNKATSKCTSLIQTLYEKVVDMSNHLVLSSAVCDSLHVCYMKEAYFHLNKFSVAIANYTIDQDADTLCRKKLDTEISVNTFTATCSTSQKVRTRDALLQLKQMVGGICKDVVMPERPICPDLPLDQRRCNIGAAFTCVLEFNRELLSEQGAPIFWRDRCTSLESTMQCAAFNTSSCDIGDDNFKTVISSLDNFREAAGYHCHWLTSDLCSRTGRCPAQDKGCDINLQMNLLKNPLSDVCLFINESNACVEKYTITCTPAQKVAASRTIQRRLQQLSVPTLKCDGTELAPCLLRAKAASWQVLTKLGDENATINACNAVTDASKCLEERVANLTNGPTLQQQTAQNLTVDLKAVIDGWCSSSGSKNCSTVVAQVINTLYNLTISLTTDMSDKAMICSARQAVLSDISETRKLHADTCDFSGFNDIENRLSSGVFSQCVINIRLDCEEAKIAADGCLKAFTSPYECSQLNSLMTCIAPALGLCEEADYKPFVQRFNNSLDPQDSCVRAPLLGLSTPTSSPLYLSEQGGSVDIKFQLMESYADFAGTSKTSSAILVGTSKTNFAVTSKRKVRIRAQVSNEDPPTCLEDLSEEISQVSVLHTGNSPCGVELDSEENWKDNHTIRLVANMDGREDSLQRTIVTLYSNVYVHVNESDSWVKTGDSVKLASFEVYIEDTDSYAVCSSVGTHTKTFDGTSFSNHEAGEFVFYRNSLIAGQVTISYQQCTQAATCTCGVTVSTQKTSVKFDRCQRVGAAVPPRDIQVEMFKEKKEKKQPDDLQVYRHSNLNEYYVVLPTGTIVTIKSSLYYLDVWVAASSKDFGRTEGLCGLYDLHAYNDLILPGGESYAVEEGEIQYGMLSPRGFVNKWKFSLLEKSVGAEATPSCSCQDSNPSDDQCSAVSRVATCDFVQGEDITNLLSDAADKEESPKERRRRAAESNSVDYSTNFTKNVGWPTASNWTEEKATEHCENLLEHTKALKYCAQAIFLARGTYPYERHVSTCVDNIRLSDSTRNDNFTIIQAIENCRSLFLHNITYQNSEAVRPTVMLFFDHTCADNCNGNGDCRMGVCHCYPGFVGGNCSYQRTALPRPFNTKVIRNGLCEVSGSSQCDDIFSTGLGFVESPYLSCHIQTAQVMPSGTKSPVGLPTKVPATLVTANLIHCHIRRSEDAQQTVMVAISNDGINPSTSMLYTAYDSRCYVCDPYSHYCRHIETNTCEIDGQCHMPDDTSAADKCLFCDPWKTPRKWSVRDLPECEDRHDSSEEEDSGEDQDDSSTQVSPLLIAILAIGAGLLILGIVGIAICLLKTRHSRPRSRDHEFGSPPPSYDNAGYISSTLDPQVFNQSNIHKRAVVRESSHIPSTMPSNWE